uniref:Uncharacterized protein n=1 Tax=Salmo trutta TaxID=8032 RepID=A0A673XRW4_SALTR
MKMKALVRSLLLLNVACLLVRGQSQTETRYEDIITAALNQLLPVEEQAFHPFLNQLELNTEDVDQSEVTVRLSFPLQETLCSKAQGQQGQPCPLKKNYSHKSCTNTSCDGFRKVKETKVQRGKCSCSIFILTQNTKSNQNNGKRTSRSAG